MMNRGCSRSPGGYRNYIFGREISGSRCTVKLYLFILFVFYAAPWIAVEFFKRAWAGGSARLEFNPIGIRGSNFLRSSDRIFLASGM